MLIDQWLDSPKTEAQQLENLGRVVYGRDTGERKNIWLAPRVELQFSSPPSTTQARMHAHTDLFSNNVEATGIY
jgi:hypothetical protein